MGFKWIGSFVCLFVCLLAWAAKDLATKMESGEELRKYYSLTPAYDPQPALNDVKIAVLDNGFSGYENDKELRFLPENTIIKSTWEEKDRVELDSTSDHGLKMAQVAWAMTGLSDTNHPQFFLLNAREIRNFRDSIKFFIEEKKKDKDKVHIMLIAMNFESYGNFDGRGFINKMVSEATAEGIITIVAAGNYHGMVHNSPIVKSDIVDTRDKDRRMLTFKGKEYLEFTSLVTENPVKITDKLGVTLSWNDFSEDLNANSDRDLNLYLEDENNNLLAKSEFKQENGPDDKSNWPREYASWIGALKKDAKYKIRVSAKASSAFNVESDKLRITLSSGRAVVGNKDAIVFKDASNTDEIMVPADNLSVITVGDLSPFCSVGPKVNGRSKPDLWLARTDVRFNTGSEPPSTSYAAAIFTGIAASLMAKEPMLNREQLLKSVGKKAVAIERAVSWEKAKGYLPHVMQAIESRLNGEKVRAVLRNGQQLAIVADTFPTEVLELIDGENQKKLAEKIDEYEIFLVARQTETGVRVSGKARGERDNYPWMAQNENPSAFVQVISEKAYRKVQAKDKEIDVKLMWSTPTPDELRQALR